MAEWAASLRSAPIRLVWTALLVFGLSAGWAVTNLFRPTAPELGWLLIPVSMTVAAMSFAVVATDRPLASDARRFWTLLAVACLPSICGYALRLGKIASGAAGNPVSSAANAPAAVGLPEMVLYFTTLVVVAFALFRLPLGLSNNRMRLTFALDICVVTVSAELLLWEVAFRPLRGHATSAITSSTWIGLVAATLGMLTVLGLAKISLARSAIVDTVSLRMLGAAVLVAAIGSTFDGLVVRYLPFATSQLALPTASLIATLAATRQLSVIAKGRARREVFRTERRRDGLRRSTFSPVPYIAVMVTLLLLVDSAFWAVRFDRILVTVGATVVVLLIVGRQLVTFQENRQLMLRLDAGMAELRDHEHRFRSLVQHSSDMIAITGADGRLTYVSPGCLPMLGSVPEQWVGRKAVDMLGGQDLDRIRDRCGQLLDRPGAVATFEVRFKHADGSLRWVHVTVTNLLHEPGINGFVCNARDITESHEFHQRLHHLAHHDGLTGLANRTLFAEQMVSALADDQPHGVSVVLVDLNDFKSINDRFGHAVGDAVLLAAAERLRTASRPDDVVARLGGDEFAVLLPATDESAAAAVVDAIAAAFGRPTQVGGLPVPLAASIGLACCTGGTEPDELLRRADVAMYAAKANRSAGDVRCAKYTPARDADFVRRGTWEADLPDALGRGELFLEYQPVVTLPDAELVGVEALLRWNHPRYGQIPPTKFIPVAERTDLVGTVGEWVLHTVCSQAAQWRMRFPTRAPTVNVNVSPSQIRDPAFVSTVVAVLTETGLPSDLLVLELAGQFDVEQAGLWESVAAIRRLGVRICLDDFGTQPSCLEILERYQVDQLKLHPRFTWSCTARDRYPMAAAISHVARSMGHDLVAEGVETAAQAIRLHELGYAKAQGCHFSPPVAAGTVGRMLHSRSSVAVG